MPKREPIASTHHKRSSKQAKYSESNFLHISSYEAASPKQPTPLRLITQSQTVVPDLIEPEMR